MHAAAPIFSRYQHRSVNASHRRGFAVETATPTLVGQAGGNAVDVTFSVVRMAWLRR